MTIQGKRYLWAFIALVVIGIIIALIRIGDAINGDNIRDREQNVATTTNEPTPTLPSVSELDTVTIQIPDTQNSVVLTNGRGRYVEEGTPFFTEVRLGDPKIVASAENTTYFVSPFGVDGGGTGYFQYIGLFTAGTPSSPQHISSDFLGDRVIIKNVRQSTDGGIEVDILVRAEDAAMAEEPTQPVTHRYQIQNNTLVKLGDTME